jgi:hypothetical protein
LDKVADGVYRLGTRWVGWYLCEVDGAVTVVDCGFPALAHRRTPPSRSPH